jgi:hypothetical protein
MLRQDNAANTQLSGRKLRATGWFYQLGPQNAEILKRAEPGPQDRTASYGYSYNVCHSQRRTVALITPGAPYPVGLLQRERLAVR